jgi:hypothetical protein
MGVDLHLRLSIFGLGQILFELDTDELPLFCLLGYFGGSNILDHFLEIWIFIGRFIALSPNDGIASVVFELEPEVELLPLLRAMIGTNGRFLLLVELFQVNDVQFLQMTVFLHLTAPTTAYLPPHWRTIPLEPVRSNL